VGDQGVDGKNNIKLILKKMGFESVDWIRLAQDIVRWRVIVNGTLWLRKRLGLS
jgi:hypothetical protein